MSKFEDLAKAATKDTAPSAPKGAPLEITEALGGRKPTDTVSVETYEVVQGPMTDEARNELKGRLMSVLGAFALIAPIPNAESISFTPDAEPKNVRERVEQGPFVYRSKAEQERKMRLPPPVTEPITKSKPTMTHPDMSKPGRTIKGESPPYRPI